MLKSKAFPCLQQAITNHERIRLNMEITYSQCGDYYIPDLVLSAEEEQRIGKYGRMRKRYLKEQHT